MKELKKEGKGIVVILHSLKELLNYTDEVIVLRNGEVVQHKKSVDLTEEIILNQMASINFSFKKTSRIKDETAFKFQNIKLDDSKPSIKIEIKKGEVIVIYGANGNKKTTLAKTIWGDRKKYELKKQNQSYIIHSPIQESKLGIAFVPEDRRKEGVFLRGSIRANISIHENGWIKKNLEVARANQLINVLSIFPHDSEKEVHHLSGGNQQKVSIAKWITPETQSSLGGILLASRVGTGHVSAGAPLLMDSITAAYIGIAMFGKGKPNIVGTFVGACLMGILLNGFTMLNVPYYAQDIIKGALLIGAIILAKKIMFKK